MPWTLLQASQPGFSKIIKPEFGCFEKYPWVAIRIEENALRTCQSG